MGITFDGSPILATPTAPAGWSGRANGRLLDFTAATITGITGPVLEFSGVAIGAIDAGPNVLTYAGGQAGFEGPPGTPVPPFTDFPLSV